MCVCVCVCVRGEGGGGGEDGGREVVSNLNWEYTDLCRYYSPHKMLCFIAIPPECQKCYFDPLTVMPASSYPVSDTNVFYPVSCYDTDLKLSNLIPVAMP